MTDALNDLDEVEVESCVTSPHVAIESLRALLAFVEEHADALEGWDLAMELHGHPRTKGVPDEESPATTEAAYVATADALGLGEEVVSSTNVEHRELLGYESRWRDRVLVPGVEVTVYGPSR